MTMLDRGDLTKEALADWHEYRQTVTDRDDLAEVYAEMTGWMARNDPLALSEFVSYRRARAARIAAIEREEPGDE